MKSEEVAFSVVEIASSASSDFITGMRIYRETTPKSIQTEADEIAHWLDKYSENHPGDLFKALLLQRRVGKRSEAIGYLQFAYFAKPNVVFVDYICIKKAERGHRAFGCFLERFEDYLENLGIGYGYIVAEVNGAEELVPEGKRATAMIRLLESEGLITPHVPYLHPSLDKDARRAPAESPFSLLVISAKCDIEGIGRDEYLEVVEALYYKHYLRWYAGIYPECEATYRRHLDQLLAKTKLMLAGKPEVLPVGGCADRPIRPTKEPSPPRDYAVRLGLGSALALGASVAVKGLYPDVGPWMTVILLSFLVAVPLAVATRNEVAVLEMASGALGSLFHRKQGKTGAGNRKKLGNN